MEGIKLNGTTTLILRNKICGRKSQRLLANYKILKHKKVEFESISHLFIYCVFLKKYNKKISQIEKTTFIFEHKICGKKSQKLFTNYKIPKQNQ